MIFFPSSSLQITIITIFVNVNKTEHAIIALKQDCAHGNCPNYMIKQFYILNMSYNLSFNPLNYSIRQL